MRRFIMMTGRNMKLFFKDKGMIFATFLTPLILLFLYLIFLRNLTYNQIENSVFQGVKVGLTEFYLYKIVPEKQLSGLTNAQLLSSLLAVSAITVSFSTNLIMVYDKTNNNIKDLLVSPVPSWQFAMSYFVSSLLTSLTILIPVASIACVIIATTGGAITFASAMALFGVIILLVLVGTATSSFINFFLKTNLQMSAVNTFISAGYGFICGGYMPLAVVGKLRGFMSILPTTFMTSLVRKFTMQDSINNIKNSVNSSSFLIEKISEQNTNIIADSISRGLAEGLDVDIIVKSHNVRIWEMILITVAVLIVLTTMFILANVISQKIKVSKKISNNSNK